MTRPTAFAHTLGARIRQLRRSRELTQEAVAKAISISRQVLSAYEHGDTLLPTDKALALCEVLAITPNELFCKACRPMPLTRGLLRRADDGDHDDAPFVRKEAVRGGR